jgi:DNA-binding MurR/RpiR family transcriptional regulator
MKETDGQKNLSLHEKIIQKYPLLSRKEKKIADHFIQNIRTAFSLSIAPLAENTGISSATIVRFAQHLGFSGFQQLRSQLVNEVKEKMMPEDRFKLLTLNGNQISTVVKVAEQEVKNINTTLRQIQQETFKKFIDNLRKGRCVYTLGIGVSSLLARLSAYLLNQAGLTTHHCLKEEHSFLEKLVLLTKKDVILGFSLPPYSRETIAAMKFCFERGVTCLSITDRATAPSPNGPTVISWPRQKI